MTDVSDVAGPSIQLNWSGPLMVGKFPKGKPEIEKAGLNTAGVYLWLQRYPETTALYAGQSTDISIRLKQHITMLFSFQYWLRKANPILSENYDTSYCFQDPGDGTLGCFNDLDKWILHARREVETVRFFYAPVTEEMIANSSLAGMTVKQSISLIEAYLINDLYDLAAQNETYVCDNGRREMSAERLANSPLQRMSHIFKGDERFKTSDLLTQFNDFLKQM